MFLKNIDHERELRISSRINNGKGEVENFFEWLNSWPDNEVIKLAEKSIDKAKNFEYTNSILNKSTYLAHIVRVAKISIELCPKVASMTICPAIIHNVLETANVSEIEILNSFDSFTLSSIKTLKINREKQHISSYLDEYYTGIAESHISVSLIKIADKIDNIFTLCLNPDENKRINYLKQIENFVIPMAKIKAPNVSTYLIDLVNDAHKTGHISLGEL